MGGRPKALLTVGGLTLGERAAAALAPAVERVVLLGEGPVPAALRDLPRLADAELGGVPAASGGGPLAALLAALRWAPGAAWLLCPCDLPGVTAEAVGWLAAQRRPGRRAVLVRLAGAERLEPLLAVYEPGIRPAVEELAARGGRAPRELAELPGVHVATPPADLATAWHDADRPEDLAEAER
jgi:molybdopterin-guanine dinucleotide biosynthesis protein A